MDGSLLLNEANAERIVATLCRVRGAALKMGQILRSIIDYLSLIDLIIDQLFISLFFFLIVLFKGRVGEGEPFSPPRPPIPGKSEFTFSRLGREGEGLWQGWALKTT